MTRRGASRAGAALLLWAAAAHAAAPEPQCPRGMRLIYTGNPYMPFQCAAPGRRSQASLPAASPADAVKPHCPPGSRADMSIEGLQPFRCVPDSQTGAEPELVPERDAAGHAEWKAQSSSPEADAAPAATRGVQIGGRRTRLDDEAAAAYRRLTLRGDAAFDIPQGWELKSAWRDEPPALTLVRGRYGRQAVISVQLHDARQAGFQDLGIALLKELEWSRGREEHRGRVGGLPARFVSVPESSLTAFVSEREDRYFRLNYAAAPDVFGAYLPAFERLLRTFRALSAEEIK